MNLQIASDARKSYLYICHGHLNPNGLNMIDIEDYLKAIHFDYHYCRIIFSIHG